jgi:hypothetical protein
VSQTPNNDRGTLHVARGTAHVARGTSHVARGTSHVARGTWHVARGTWQVAALLVCLAAIVPYLATVNDYFLRDDFGVVQLLSQRPASFFFKWFTMSWMEDIWGFIPDEVRPFPAASYQLTALAGAANPMAHHVMNIALHAANGLLILGIAVRFMGMSLSAATFAAVVFVLLPAHPETVAWITGRVDSMPAFFYLGTFYAYARFRDASTPGPGSRVPSPESRVPALWYVCSLILFFVALFTKQNTITMVATLVAYDLIVRRDFSFRIGRYGAFLAMTAGYLALRYELFGQVARENQLSEEGLKSFIGLVDRHLARVVIGDVDGSRVVLWLVIASVVVVWWVSRRHPSGSPRLADVMLFAGPVWWIIGVAPVAVAGYESPRHVYLAAVGWGLTLGAIFDAVRSWWPAPFWRYACTAAAVLALLAYVWQLTGGIGHYRDLAAVSHQAVQGVRAEVLNGPQGGLVIVGVPGQSWDWALPFAVRPPFTRTDLTSRAFIISPRALHCCSGQWFNDTKRHLRNWSTGPAQYSVTLLRWTEQPGSGGRVTSADNPALPDIARALLTIDHPGVLEANIQRMLRELIPAPPNLR